MRRIGLERHMSSLLTSAGILALMAVGATSAQAQSQAATAKPVSTVGVETVIVTAERRAERQQDVPISITNLTSEDLTQAGVHQLAGIQNVTPALRFDRAGPFEQPTIRGVGSAVETSGAGSNVGVYVDGFYLVNQLTMDLQLLNIKNIQVLKGPQGTLFGHNTTGGAILVTTTKPSVETSGTLDASYGGYNAQRYQGYFTTGLTDNLAVDIAGMFSKGDGYAHDIVTGSDTDGAYKNWMIRTGVEFDPTDNISILFRYLHEDTNDPSSIMYNAYVDNGMAQAPGAVYPGAIVATRSNQVAYAGDAAFRSKSDAFQLTLSFDLNFATLKSYTQYRKDKSGTTGQDYAQTTLPASIYPCVNGKPYCHLLNLGISPVKDRVITQEFLLSSNGDTRLKWTAGLFYLDYRDHLSASLSQMGGPYAQVADNGTDTLSVAAYVDATYQVLNDLYLTAGVRYSHDEVRDPFFHLGSTIVRLPTLSGDRLSPRAVIRYTPSDNSSVYFSFSRGFKAAIYNVGGDQTAPVKPESINAYEVGYKYAANRLSLDVASYYYDYTNLQVASYTSIPVPASIVSNAASSRIYGFEGQLHYQVTPAFNFGIGAAYTDAKYVNFQNAPNYTQCLDPVACGSYFGFFNSGSTNLRDAPMLRAPKFTGNISARYTTGLAGGSLSLSGNLYYTTKVYFDTSHQYYQKAYPLLSLRAEWTDPSGRYTLAVYGENVTDTAYKTQVLATNPGIGAAWGRPATFGGEIRYHFD